MTSKAAGRPDADLFGAVAGVHRRAQNRDHRDRDGAAPEGRHPVPEAAQAHHRAAVSQPVRTVSVKGIRAGAGALCGDPRALGADPQLVPLSRTRGAAGLGILDRRGQFR